MLHVAADMANHTNKFSQELTPRIVSWSKLERGHDLESLATLKSKPVQSKKGHLAFYNLIRCIVNVGLANLTGDS